MIAIRQETKEKRNEQNLVPIAKKTFAVLVKHTKKQSRARDTILPVKPRFLGFILPSPQKMLPVKNSKAIASFETDRRKFRNWKY